MRKFTAKIKLVLILIIFFAVLRIFVSPLVHFWDTSMAASCMFILTLAHHL